jgi:hypothetical protein
MENGMPSVWGPNIDNGIPEHNDGVRPAAVVLGNVVADLHMGAKSGNMDDPTWDFVTEMEKLRLQAELFLTIHNNLRAKWKKNDCLVGAM